MSDVTQRRMMRECRLALEDDLFKRVKSRNPDRYIEWRSPGDGFTVLLGYGARGIEGQVEDGDGKVLAATVDATPEWLGEVLP